MADFTRVIRMEGFDRYQVPRWQMVPSGGVRYIALHDGAALTVSSLNPAVVTVAEVTRVTVPAAGRVPLPAADRIFKLSGVGHGKTRIQAKAGAAIRVELEVDVKDKKTVNLAFNFVRDNAGHRTSRNTSHVTRWLDGINAIYKGQANIEFMRKSSQAVTVPQNLGRVVRFSSHLAGVPAAQHEWAAVTAMGDATADMNIFFVWEYEQDNSPFTDDTDAGTLTNNCIFEDGAGVQLAATLAHEIGHYLGSPDHYVVARNRELMYGITDRRGAHLPKQDVNIMNP